MYATSLRLILLASVAMVDYLCPEEMQAEVLSTLDVLDCRCTVPGRTKRAIRAAILFTESSAWSLLWPRIKYEHNQAGGEMSAVKLVELDRCLQEHFLPIEEELT
jgi:hypothetical protein